MKQKHKIKVKKVVIMDMKKSTRSKDEIKTEDTNLIFYLSKIWVQICFNIVKL